MATQSRGHGTRNPMNQESDHSEDSQRRQITLFCPHCDYNLTGLPENRCPECGEPFDPQQLLAEEAACPKPISLKTAAIRLLWPSIGCSLSALVYVPGLFELAMFLLIVYAMPNAFMVAERIIAGRAARRGMGFSRMRDWKRIVALWLVLYVVQLAVAALAIGGMTGILLLIMWEP